MEAAKSLVRHGFKRFLILNAHGGNRAITTYFVGRINRETRGLRWTCGRAAGLSGGSASW